MSWTVLFGPVGKVSGTARVAGPVFLPAGSDVMYRGPQRFFRKGKRYRAVVSYCFVDFTYNAVYVTTENDEEIV